LQLGANWEQVGPVLKRFEYAILGVLAVIVIAWVWFRIIKPRRAARIGA
jgi:membrane protein DedA with SNARE-associated domain